jgi:hypothetical protein
MRKEINETIKTIETYKEVIKLIIDNFESNHIKVRSSDDLLYKSLTLSSVGLDEEVERLRAQRSFSSFEHENVAYTLINKGWKKILKGFKKDNLLIENSNIDKLTSEYINSLGMEKIVQFLIEGVEDLGNSNIEKQLSNRICPLCSNNSIDYNNICGYCSTEYCEACSGILKIDPAMAFTNSTKIRKCICRE